MARTASWVILGIWSRVTYARLMSATVASDEPSFARIVERSAKEPIETFRLDRSRNWLLNCFTAFPAPPNAGNSPAATSAEAARITKGIRKIRRITSVGLAEEEVGT